MELNNLGIVFAGGGAKGAYQIGALKAMKELNLLDSVVAVSGASIGGINEALLLGSTVEKAYDCWKNFDGSEFLQFDSNGFDITKYGDGIFTRDALLKIIREAVDYSKISSSDIKSYICVCYQNEEKQEKAKYVTLNGLSDDMIEKYLLATSAIPLVYDAVLVEGDLLYDGGMVDNTPITPLYEAGIKNIVVISNDANYRTNKEDYGNANIIDIVPSSSLDMDTLLGTVDFNAEHSVYRLSLGYYDAKMIIQAHMKDVKVPNLSGNANLARNEMKITFADKSVKENMSNLENMLGKYGIKL